MAYLLDSDVFIQAKNLHYGFDFCPAFWDWIDRAHSTGTIFSIDRVRTEIVGGGDDLATWALTKTDAFFLQPDASHALAHHHTVVTHEVFAPTPKKIKIPTRASA
jgi:hypothetical protein